MTHCGNSDCKGNDPNHQKGISHRFVKAQQKTTFPSLKRTQNTKVGIQPPKPKKMAFAEFQTYITTGYSTWNARVGFRIYSLGIPMEGSEL